MRPAERSGAMSNAFHNAMPKILLVEDNEMNRDMLSRRLERKGYQVVLAVDGQSGVEMAQAEAPDLILMDMSLPVLDGWEASRNLKAARALGALKKAAAPAIQALVALLQDREESVRAAVAEAIGQIGCLNEQATDDLALGLASPDNMVRAQTAEALGTIGTSAQETAPALVEAVADRNDVVRAAAVEAVGEWGEPNEAALSGLFALLEDTNDQVKVQVTKVLPKLAGATPVVIDALCRRLLEDDSVWVQAHAALALGKLGPAAATAGGPLLRATQTGEVSVREQAMRAIAMIQPPESMTALAEGLKDASGEIRKVASAGLMKAAEIPPEVVPGLIDALRDPEVHVRANAAHVLGRLDALPADAIPLLIACTADPSDGLRMNAAMALKLAPAGAAGEAMQRLVEDANVRIRLIAASVLLPVDPANAKAGAAVVEALSDPAVRLRKAALQLVESLGPSGAAFLDALRQRAGLEEPEVRDAVVRLVGRLDSQVRADHDKIPDQMRVIVPG